MVYLLNTMMPWRMVGLACMFVPLSTIVALYFVSILLFCCSLLCEYFFFEFIFDLTLLERQKL